MNCKVWLLCFVLYLAATQVSAQEAPPAMNVYLFGEGSTYVKINTQKLLASPIRNLTSRLGLAAVHHPVSDSSNNRVLVFDHAAKTGNQQDGFQTEVAVLKSDQHGELGLSKKIAIDAPATPDPAVGPHDNVSGLAISPDGKTIYISWTDGKKGLITGVFDANSYMKGKEIGNFFVDKGMCFPASAQVVDTIWANDVYSFSIPDYIPIKHLKITEQIGGKNAYAKILIDIAQCQAVILENESRPVPSAVNSKIFVVDVESNRVLSETPLKFLGDYQLISNLGLLLVDEERYSSWDYAGGEMGQIGESPRI